MFNVLDIFLVSFRAVDDHASLGVTINQHSVLANSGNNGHIGSFCTARFLGCDLTTKMIEAG